jgi:1,4-alpha-glucan branching enzyme
VAGVVEELPADLRALAAAYGLEATYVDHGGVVRTASREAVVAVIESLDGRGAADDATGALAAHRAAMVERLLEPVVVVGPGAPTATRVAVVGAPVAALACALTTEDGERTEWRQRDVGAGGGFVELPHALPPGYHTLTVAAGSRRSTAHLLARPEGGARGRFDAGWRAVGVAAPLFTLHSARSWGCGDLADLEALAALVAAHGATVLATLPLLAGPGPAQFEPSPYLPLSRTFWHERWLDVDAAIARAHDPSLTTLAQDARDRARKAAAAAHPYVDGESSLRAKRDVLEALLVALGPPGGRGREGLEAFVAQRPAVADYARFRAAGERHGVDWHRWPARLRDGEIEDRDVDAAVADVHAMAQWLAHDQLVALSAALAERDQVLALDLPLGVHARGYDVWRHRGQFLPGLSVGAPPDRFFPSGQVWGFPPPRVAAARGDGHQLFRAALVHHLTCASMLRIDHVLGTQRLFCVPDGMAAADGVYVRMPLEELLAVVAIEAHRHHAAIVGEDLGTVDAPVRRAMQRDGVRRTSVVQLSIRPAGTAPFVPPAAGAIASFSTHDLPTFEGWWRAADVDERLALGQVDGRTAAEMRAKRHAERSRLATVLGGAAADGDDPPAGLLAGVHRALAESEAGLVVAQLDDLLGEREAVNLPGTSTERRNWQRRTAVALEAIADDPRVGPGIGAIRARRADPAATSAGTVTGVTRLTDEDEAAFADGRHARLHHVLGAHVMDLAGVSGTYFAVWAPRAASVEVVGDFNGWDGHRHPLGRRDSGIFEGFVADVGPGERYKFRVTSARGDVVDKADPFARRAEAPPRTASITHVPEHRWSDGAWLARRDARQSPRAAISVYEVHLGSWRRDPADPARALAYDEVAPRLAEHAHRHGFTHVELLPVMEHPFDGSWGYQLSGYFAPTARYGTPDEFAALVDELHRAGLGVLLDWVPGHFPADAFALAAFDGDALYEHPDPDFAVHPEWTSLVFDYARGEVRSFLISAACAWLERYHVDGLRFDAVASMLYLDYARGPGEWAPNPLGGNENLDAVAFLQACNTAIHRDFPGAITVAEESTAWPGVTADVADGGLGFDYKWDLGWMHDTLDYLHEPPARRPARHRRLTFRSLYSRSERFVLPLSHDEVVHGKGSLLGQMAGRDVDEQLACLRLLLGYQLLQPGKKLLFMGDEFGQVGEWAYDRALDWGLLDEPGHRGVAALVATLNALYRDEPALHRDDLDDLGFAFLDADDEAACVLTVERHDGAGRCLVIAANASDVAREGYLVGLAVGGRWTLRVSSDDVAFGGGGHPVRAVLEAVDAPWQRRPHRAALDLPPLGFVIYGPSAAPDVPGGTEATH